MADLRAATARNPRDAGLRDLVAGSDLRVVAFTAAPGSEDADKLRLLGVLGTQDFAQRV